MLKAIGVIPDGNRRYAEEKDITYKESYQEGFKRGESLFKWCINHPSIDKAVIYALSTENIKRNSSELSTLYELYEKNLEDLAKSPEVHENEVNVQLIGRKEYLEPLQEQAERLKEETGGYDKYNIRIALGYGGRAEIIDAAENLARENKCFTEENFNEELYFPFDLDLVIRTGGYSRLSNFQLWQAAYAELYFSDKLWPEFDEEEFNRAVGFYEDTKRKFGE